MLTRNLGNPHVRLALGQIYLRGRLVDNAIALMDELNAAGQLDDNGRYALMAAATDVFEGASAPVAKFADALLATHPGDAELKVAIAEFGKASRP